jgi:hypothetical protein
MIIMGVDVGRGVGVGLGVVVGLGVQVGSMRMRGVDVAGISVGEAFMAGVAVAAGVQPAKINSMHMEK